MNTIPLSETIHPPQPRPFAEAVALIPYRTPRTSVADRIAMRIGLRLLLWSTRERPAVHVRHDADLVRVANEARAEHTAAVARAYVRGAVPPAVR